MRKRLNNFSKAFHLICSIFFAILCALVFFLNDFKSNQSNLIINFSKDIPSTVHIWWDDSRGFAPNRSRVYTPSQENSEINLILPAVKINEIRIVSQQPIDDSQIKIWRHQDKLFEFETNQISSDDANFKNYTRVTPAKGAKHIRKSQP